MKDETESAVRGGIIGIRDGSGREGTDDAGCIELPIAMVTAASSPEQHTARPIRRAAHAPMDTRRHPPGNVPSFSSAADPAAAPQAPSLPACPTDCAADTSPAKGNRIRCTHPVGRVAASTARFDHSNQPSTPPKASASPPPSVCACSAAYPAPAGLPPAESPPSAPRESPQRAAELLAHTFADCPRCASSGSALPPRNSAVWKLQRRFVAPPAPPSTPAEPAPASLSS